MATDDFFRARLEQMIDLRHPLAVLATRLPWSAIERWRPTWRTERSQLSGRSLRICWAHTTWSSVAASATPGARDCRCA